MSDPEEVLRLARRLYDETMRKPTRERKISVGAFGRMLAAAEHVRGERDEARARADQLRRRVPLATWKHMAPPIEVAEQHPWETHDE